MYYLFTWTSGTFNFEAGVRPEREDFLVRINPESLLLEGARRVDEWSLIEKKIPSFDLIFAVDPAPHRRVGAELSAEQQRLLPLLDGTRDVQAGHRRIRAGRVRGREGAVRPDHRRVRPPGRAPRPRPRPRSTTAGWTSTGTSASPSTRPACSTRRCASSAGWPSCGPPTPARRSSSGSSRCGRRAGRRRPTPSARPPRRAVPRPAALHNLGFALERLGRLDEAEAAYGDAAGRARDDARDHAGLEHRRAEAGRAPGGPGRGWRGRCELLRRQAGAGALVLGRHAGERRARRRGRRAARRPGRGRGVSRRRGAAEQSRRAARAAAATSPAPRRRSAPRWPKTRRCPRSPRTWPTSSTATAATTRRARPTSGRPSSRPSWATTCTSSWATSPTSGATRRGRAESWSRATALNPGHELARANLEMLDLAP